jgi:hypothetical protein
MAKTSKVAATVTVDFRFENHGTIWLLHPLTGAAIDWVDQHIPNDALHFGVAIVVEHRYVDDIAFGIQNDGLEVR